MSLMSDRIRALRSPLVTIIAGVEPDSMTFEVPKDILTRGSTWFNGALQDERFLEGNTLVIRMPEDPPTAVEALLYFVDTGGLDYFDDDFEATEGEDDTHGLTRRAGELQAAFTLWMLAQKYLLPVLQNAAMSRISQLLNSDFHDAAIPTETLTEGYKIANGADPLQTVVADYIVDRLDRKCIAVSGDLGACPGFIDAMHASEHALHQGFRGDFPRFRKLPLFEDLLRMEVPEQEDHIASVYFGDFWDKKQICEDCGQRCDKPTIQCNFGHWTSCHRGHGTLKVFCEDCAEDKRKK